ncbi:MAG TPA: CAAX prenyl protease-related protein [Chthoniobacteraceae bacterium]|nr:CAAX prenyl protease-related protein [Chthoniobacteraceae bacterium]
MERRAPLANPVLRAFCAPFVIFLLFFPVIDLLRKLGSSHWWLADPQYWVFPLQTVVCAVLIWRGWRHYRLKWSKSGGDWAWTILIAVLVLAIWISPQQWLGFAPRLEGFDPTVFEPGSAAYRGSLLMRFLRLVVIVPILEEVFWRGFLLRYLIDEDFEKVPFGSFSWLSFVAVSVAFALVHQPADWVAALLTGALYNAIAIRTKSLSLCIVAHAITNLLLGFYIMKTGQWGFW